MGLKHLITNLLSPAFPIHLQHWPLHSHPYIRIHLDQWTSAQKHSLSWPCLSLLTWPMLHTGLIRTPSFLWQSKISLLQIPAQTFPSLWHPTPHPFSLFTLPTVWISHLISHAMERFLALVAYQNHLWDFKNAYSQAHFQKDSDSVGLLGVLDFEVFVRISDTWPGSRFSI